MTIPSYAASDHETLREQPSRTGSLQDFFPSVDHAIRHGYTKRFITKWSGDRSVYLQVEHHPFTLEDVGALDTVAQHALVANREVAFGGLIDEQHRRIVSVTMGSFGTRDECDWNAGDLLEVLRNEATKNDLKYFLGHTHPERYGAICSKEYWSAAQLRKYRDPVSRAMLRSGIYQYFGTDMAEMRVRQWLDPQLSSYFWILSPRHRQAGLFRIDPGSPDEFDDAVNTYVPWTPGSRRHLNLLDGAD